ncbi:MAG: hypothetical protein RI926_559 [Actinomycetota bacterium]|jgi:uncharacterized repeat protein (TIGR02543 family)
MTKLSFKALGAAILAVGIVLVGAAATAQAASMTNFTASTSGTLAAGQVITSDIVVSFTAPTAVPQSINNQIRIVLTNTSGFGAGSACGLRVAYVSSPSIVASCQAVSGSGVSQVYLYSAGLPGITIGANSTYTFTILGGTLTQNAAGPISVTAFSSSSPTPIDLSTTTLTAASVSSTVSFDANGGSGSMSAQTSSTALALTSNAFSRTNYTFAGWNTSADGSGTTFADAASYPFTASETLYAQWTAVLANTGVEAKPYLFGGLALAIVGSGMLFIAHRKQTN